eukprot:m.692970 g.692970  ORF g.692970 m.692970 type:complete len:1105 (+) comp22867_c0_seq24:312-3626(+)
MMIMRAVVILVAAISTVCVQGDVPEQGSDGNYSFVSCGERLQSSTRDGIDVLGGQAFDKIFRFTAINRTLVDIGACEANFGVSLRVYSIISLSSELYFGVGDGCLTESEHLTTKLSVILEAGEYLIAVEGVDGTVGDFNLTIGCEIAEVARSQGTLSCGSTSMAFTATGSNEVAGPGPEHVYQLVEQGHAAGITPLGSVTIIDACFTQTDVNLNIYLFDVGNFSAPVAMSGPCPDVGMRGGKLVLVAPPATTLNYTVVVEPGDAVVHGGYELSVSCFDGARDSMSYQCQAIGDGTPDINSMLAMSIELPGYSDDAIDACWQFCIANNCLLFALKVAETEAHTCYVSNHTGFYVGPPVPVEFPGEQRFPLDVFEGICYRVTPYTTTATTSSTQSPVAMETTGGCLFCEDTVSEVDDVLGGDKVRASIDSTTEFLAIVDDLANDTLRTVQNSSDEAQTRQAIQNLTIVVEYVVSGAPGFNGVEKLSAIDDLLNASAGIGLIRGGRSYSNSSTASLLFGIRSSIDLMVTAYDSDLDSADGSNDSIVLRQFSSGSDTNIYGFVRAFRKPADGGTTALTTFPDGATNSDIVFVVPLSVFESDIGGISYVRFPNDTFFTRADDDNATARPVASVVLSVFVAGTVRTTNLTDDVCGVFDHSLNLGGMSISDPNPECVYYNETTMMWDTGGCYINEVINSTHVQCCCNHLTSFAVIVSSNTASNSHSAKALAIISIVGIALSLTAILITFVFVVYIRALRTQLRYMILLTMLFALAMLQALFLCIAEDAMTDDESTCRKISTSVLYFFLAYLAWQCVENYYLYETFVTVFDVGTDSPSRRYVKLSVLGWGVPGCILLGTVLGFEQRDFVTFQPDDSDNASDVAYCWIDVSKDIKWVMIVPLAASIAWNVYVFVRVLRVTLRHTQRDQRQHGWASLRVIGCLSAATGVAWFLAIFLFFDLSDYEFVEYIFVVAVLSQGIFIFYFHCWTNEHVRKIRKEMTESFKPSDSSTSKGPKSGGARVVRRDRTTTDTWGIPFPANSSGGNSFGGSMSASAGDAEASTSSVARSQASILLSTDTVWERDGESFFVDFSNPQVPPFIQYPVQVRVWVFLYV